MAQVHQAAIKEMVDWFQAHYDDPVDCMPVDGGEYVWLVEPRDAREELEEQFPNADEDCLTAAVEEIEREGTYEWAAVKDLDDFTK